jgi:hypothetical protein
MIFIPIDRDTIRRNSDAGSHEILIPGKPYVEGSTLTTPVTRLSLIGRIPEFSYSYEPIQVTCKYCGATFPWEELESYSDEETYVVKGEARICPKCSTWECCDELEWEEFKPEMYKEVI